MRSGERRGENEGGMRDGSVTEWNFSRARLCRQRPPLVSCSPGKQVHHHGEGETFTLHMYCNNLICPQTLYICGLKL